MQHIEAVDAANVNLVEAVFERFVIQAKKDKKINEIAINDAIDYVRRKYENDGLLSKKRTSSKKPNAAKAKGDDDAWKTFPGNPGWSFTTDISDANQGYIRNPSKLVVAQINMKGDGDKLTDADVLFLSRKGIAYKRS